MVASTPAGPIGQAAGATAAATAATTAIHPQRARSGSTTRRWKCGVCSAKAGDLVCSGCVGQEAERRRQTRAHRLAALRVVRETAAAAVQERTNSIAREAELEREAAEEVRLREEIRKVTQRVAEERIQVASAAFSLKHQRDLLAAADFRLAQEQDSVVELEEALLRGLRRHAADAARVLRQRRWRKVVQIFVLLPIEPSLPRESGGSGGGGGDAGGGVGGRAGAREGLGAAVSGVSTLMDLPLPNNGDYSQVPPDVLMAVLCLVARLVSDIASCLGVSLPHPLSPAASMRYAAVAVDSSPRERFSQYPLCPLSKLAETGVMGGSSSVMNTVGAFETALDLLCTDVVHLCVEGANVPVDRLWPAQALLLNLWELQQHANSELRSSFPIVDVPIPVPRDYPGDTNTTEHGGDMGRRRNSIALNRRTSSTPTMVGLASAIGGDGLVPPLPPDNRYGGGSGGSGGGVDSLAGQQDGSGDRRGFPLAGGTGADDEEGTYEFVAGDVVAEPRRNEDGAPPGGGSGGSGRRSWGSRLADAAGSAGGLGSWG